MNNFTDIYDTNVSDKIFIVNFYEQLGNLCHDLIDGFLQLRLRVGKKVRVVVY